MKQPYISNLRQATLGVSAAFLLILGGSVFSSETIDFENTTAGDIVDQVFSAGGAGPVGVSGSNPDLDSRFPPGPNNAAVIFDTANPPGIDFDLGTPNEDFGGPGIGAGGEAGATYQNDTAKGNILIINEARYFVDRDSSGSIDSNDSPVERTDDADNTNEPIVFDFSALGPVTIESITLIDVEAEEGTATVELKDSSDVTLATFDLPKTGNNGVAPNIPLGPTSDVATMIVILNGSGGIDDVVFTSGERGIDIEKKTNGNQADGANDGDVPQITYGDVVTWSYEVTNTGDIPFSEAEVIVTDDQPGVTPVLDTSSDAGGDLILSPGETWIYTATGQALDLPNAPTDVTVVPGCNDGRETYENLGTVVIGETDLTDTDPSHYCNPPRGGEGCTPGFWKQEQHFAAWLNPPYAPSTPFSDVFEDAFPGKTLLDVLKQGGGGKKALGRHTVAALLNSATTDVDYDFGMPADVINAFNEVYPGNKRDYNHLKREFSYLNEQGCPINGKYPPSNLAD